MRVIQLIALSLLIPVHLFAQLPGTYGNEWLFNASPNQSFIKLLVHTDGVYRLSSADFLQAGYDLSTVNPDELKLIYRGTEIPIYVRETPGGATEFIEFVGKRNDGRVDSILYKDPATGLHAPGIQPNIDISLFTDTSAYFLTWSAGPGLRYQTFSDTNYGLYTPEASFAYEARRIFELGDSLTEYVLGGGGVYDSFYTLNSDYGPGEGYVGPEFAYLSPYTLPLETPYAQNGPMDSLQFQVRIFGRSNTQHRHQMQLNGGPILDTAYHNSGVTINTHHRTLGPFTLTDTSLITFEATFSNIDLNHICWASLTYPRETTAGGDSTLLISAFSHATPAYFQFREIAGDDTVWVYDEQNRTRISGIVSGDTAHILVPGLVGERDLLLSTDRAVYKPVIAEPEFANLSNPVQGAEYIIITHRELAASAQAYATYRDTNQINAYSTQVIYTDQIYDEFGYGSLTPWAIKRFLNYALENWTIKPRYVLFWGQGRFRTREYSGVIVPTFGYPNTDYEFVSPISPDSLDVKPRISVGRVNVQHDVEGDAYLAKIRMYEHLPWQEWMRRAIFVSSSNNSSEHAIFTNLQDTSAARLQAELVPWISKRFPTTFPPTLPADTLSLQASLDTGAAFLSLLGYQVPFPGNGVWVKEPYEYTNWNKPPFIIGQFAVGSDLSTRGYSSRWVLEPVRGAIGFLGNSAPNYLNPMSVYNRRLYQNWWGDTLGLRIGDMIRQTFSDYIDIQVSVIARNVALQMNLQGDPALRLHPAPFSFGDVWPGDANHDGVADMMDLLPIGLAYGDTGYTRPDANLSWTPQAAPDWPQVFPDTVNYKHADTNGDSIINDLDTVAIQLNYGLTHNKTEDANFIAGGVPLQLVYPALGLQGDTVKIQVVLGDSVHLADSVYGLAFTMRYDRNLVADSSLKVLFDPSWLGTNGVDALALYHDRPLDGEVDIAFTRTDHVPVTGFGKIADVSIVITDDLAKKAWENWAEPELAFGYAHNEVGIEIPLDNPVPTSYLPPPRGDAWVYPNPAYQKTHLNPKGYELTNIVLADLQGRTLFQQASLRGNILAFEVSDLSPGVYLIRFEREGEQEVVKVLVLP